MTKYQAQIDFALNKISEKGIDVVIRRTAVAEIVTYDEGDYGTLSAAGKIFSFSSGDISAVLSAGDTISFREISEFDNRGPFEVVSVTGNDVEVNADLADMSDSVWFMDVQSGSPTYATGKCVPLPPQSVTRQSFEQDFRDGTLQIGRAWDLLLAAKGLEFDPLPGDKLQLGNTVWDSTDEVWLIHGIGSIAPDLEPILWQGIITKG